MPSLPLRYAARVWALTVFAESSRMPQVTFIPYTQLFAESRCHAESSEVSKQEPLCLCTHKPDTQEFGPRRR